MTLDVNVKSSRSKTAGSPPPISLHLLLRWNQDIKILPRKQAEQTSNTKSNLRNFQVVSSCTFSFNMPLCSWGSPMEPLSCDSKISWKQCRDRSLDRMPHTATSCHTIHWLVHLASVSHSKSLKETSGSCQKSPCESLPDPWFSVPPQDKFSSKPVSDAIKTATSDKLQPGHKCFKCLWPNFLHVRRRAMRRKPERTTTNGNRNVASLAVQIPSYCAWLTCSLLDFTKNTSTKNFPELKTNLK